MTKTNHTTFLMGDPVPVYFCDQCEEVLDGPSLHWEDKDFTLCINCLEKSYKLVFEQPHSNKVSRSNKKAIPARLKTTMFERDGYKCRYCGSQHDLTADHVQPESRGGETSLDNLVTACRKCNLQKRARTPKEAGMMLIEIST